MGRRLVFLFVEERKQKAELEKEKARDLVRAQFLAAKHAMEEEARRNKKSLLQKIEIFFSPVVRALSSTVKSAADRAVTLAAAKVGPSEDELLDALEAKMSEEEDDEDAIKRSMKKASKKKSSIEKLTQVDTIGAAYPLVTTSPEPDTT